MPSYQITLRDGSVRRFEEPEGLHMSIAYKPGFVTVSTGKIRSLGLFASGLEITTVNEVTIAASEILEISRITT